MPRETLTLGFSGGHLPPPGPPSVPPEVKVTTSTLHLRSAGKRRVGARGHARPDTVGWTPGWVYIEGPQPVAPALPPPPTRVARPRERSRSPLPRQQSSSTSSKAAPDAADSEFATVTVEAEPKRRKALRPGSVTVGSSWACGPSASALVSPSWQEHAPPRLTPESVAAMSATFAKNFHGELLTPDSTLSIRLLSIARHQLRPGQSLKYVPWQLRLSQKQYQDMMWKPKCTNLCAAGSYLG